MISGKHIPALTAVLLVLALALGCLIPTAFGSESGVSYAYETAVFGQQLLTVDIVINEDDWSDLLENATAEEYYPCNVIVGGNKCKNVGIRAKGNTSLSQVAASDSDRYSFKLKFDEYESGKTCGGLDMLVLNNLIADNTYMKEYLTYDMFAYLGADASLYTMAAVTVNGEPWGIYLALEPVNETFLQRNYGANSGSLYKPDTLQMGEGGGKGGFGGEKVDPANLPADMQNRPAFDPQNAQTAPDAQTDANAGNRHQMGGGFGSGSGGSNLNYIDDNLDSYSAIWDGAKTDVTEKDEQRVVDALAAIHNRENLDDVMDVDNLLRYMAVQTFVVNLDSLTGNMAHNYYLYEENGKLNLIPWDYNLAFGGFQSSSASDLINFPIDTPFSGVSMEDRDFFAALLENETHLAQYHEYLNELCTGYAADVFPKTYAALRTMLDPLVASADADPTAFCTNDEYTAAAEMLYKTINRRATGILGQLDGSIPPTTAGQSENPDALLDSSMIDVSVMGTQGGGKGGMGDMKFDRVGQQTAQADAPQNTQSDAPNAAPQNGQQTPPDAQGQDAQNNTRMTRPDRQAGITPPDQTQKVSSLSPLAISITVGSLVLLGTALFVFRAWKRTHTL